MRDRYEIALDTGSNGWAVINHQRSRFGGVTVIDRGLSYYDAMKLAGQLSSMNIAPPANENC